MSKVGVKHLSINQSKTFINTFICTSTCWNQKKIESVGFRTSKNKKMKIDTSNNSGR
jgi:hypothetical protein